MPGTKVLNKYINATPFSYTMLCVNYISIVGKKKNFQNRKHSVPIIPVGSGFTGQLLKLTTLSSSRSKDTKTGSTILISSLHFLQITILKSLLWVHIHLIVSCIDNSHVLLTFHQCC